VETCPTGYVGSIEYGVCTLPEDSSFGCENKPMSSDKKTCDFNCPYDEILIEGGDCVASCTIPGCSSCPDGMILY